MIRVIEVGPRDGLQNERRIIPTDVKVAFVNLLSLTGVDEVEVSAFVSPKKVPQLADAEHVLSQIERVPGVVYSALVPNTQGLDRALEAKVDKIGLFTAASETFNRRNINASIDESFDRFGPVLTRAREAKLIVRGYVSTAFWCPYEGRVDPKVAAEVIWRLFELGVDEVSIGDTIGKASPDEVRLLLDIALKHADPSRLNMHFHDTFGRGAANALAALAFGVTCFDSSTGGIGGCPFAPGAPGNLATETLVETLKGSDTPTRVDLAAVAAAREVILPHLGQPGDSQVEIY
ncbi:MAG: hydroxymethylglutaryl-CoA lyase [Myxococcota bacterium]